MYYDDEVLMEGINEIVFNFKPWLDWYLETTGQRLVGEEVAFAPAASHGGSDAIWCIRCRVSHVGDAAPATMPHLGILILKLGKVGTTV